MKKMLLMLVVILSIAPFTNAADGIPQMNLVDNGNHTYGINVPNGMTSTTGSLFTGVYFIVIGVDPGSGSLTMPAPIATILSLSSANEGDAGDTGLFPYGVGTYGEFRATTDNFNATPGGVWADTYSLLQGATKVQLYTTDNSMSQDSLTLVSQINVPDPITMSLLAIGGLFLRRRK